MNVVYLLTFFQKLENALDFWLSDLTDEERLTPADNLKYIPLLLAYNYDSILTDKSVIDVMFSLYKNETINTIPPYQITNGLSKNDIHINKNIRLSLAKDINHVDYAYAYTLQNEYTYLIKDLGLQGKVDQINEYINMCNVYTQIDEQVLDLTTQLYQYKYQPDPVILEYLHQAEKLLSPLVSEDILLNILCNIASILMKEKYNNWTAYTENLISRYDKFELLNVLRNVTIIDTDSTKTFLILLNKLKQECLIYTE